MTQNTDHFRLVERWVTQSLRDLPRDELVDAFGRTFGCVWTKAQLTLGGVTMHAIIDRVLYVAQARYAWLAPLQAEPAGLSFAKFAAGTGSVSDEELRQGLAFLLGELLTVIGNVSAEVISTKLHACLQRPDPKIGKK